MGKKDNGNVTETNMKQWIMGQTGGRYVKEINKRKRLIRGRQTREGG